METVTVMFIMAIAGVYHDPSSSNILLQDYLFVDIRDNYKVETLDVTYNPNIDSMNENPITGDWVEMPIKTYYECADTAIDNPLRQYYFILITKINHHHAEPPKDPTQINVTVIMLLKGSKMEGNEKRREVVVSDGIFCKAFYDNVKWKDTIGTEFKMDAVDFFNIPDTAGISVPRKIQLKYYNNDGDDGGDE